MMNNKKLLLVEFVVLFWAVPLILVFYQTPVLKILFLLSGTFYAIFILKRSQKLNLLRNKKALSKRDIAAFIIRLLIAGSLILISGFLLRRGNFFQVPFEPVLIPLLLIGYPVVSVLPQEIIYRLFFFERYKSLIDSIARMLLVNALSFAFMHIIYGNITAVILSFAGGVLFSWTYARNGLLLLTVIEHSFYGYLIFLAGYAPFFITENIFKMLFHTG